MTISLYCVGPFESKLNLNAVTKILNSCEGVEIVNKGLVSGHLPDGELGTEYFDSCLKNSDDEFAIYLTSRPLSSGWFVIRNHLDMKNYSFIKQDRKWIAVTVDYIEELAQLKDLDLNRLCAFNIYKAIIVTDFMFRGLSYIGDIYPGIKTIEDSSFIFCRNKSDFVTAYRLAKLGARLESVLLKNNIAMSKIDLYQKNLIKIKETRAQNFFRIRNSRELSHNIIISIIFGTLASLIASFVYTRLPDMTSKLPDEKTIVSEKLAQP